MLNQFDRKHWFFEREHSGVAPEPLKPLRPLWQDFTYALAAVLLIAACLKWH